MDAIGNDGKNKKAIHIKNIKTSKCLVHDFE